MKVCNTKVLQFFFVFKTLSMTTRACCEEFLNVKAGRHMIMNYINAWGGVTRDSLTNSDNIVWETFCTWLWCAHISITISIALLPKFEGTFIVCLKIKNKNQCFWIWRFYLLPVSDELVHSANEIFFLFRHVYKLPLNAAHLCKTHATKNTKTLVIEIPNWNKKETKKLTQSSHLFGLFSKKIKTQKVSLQRMAFVQERNKTKKRQQKMKKTRSRTKEKMEKP